MENALYYGDNLEVLRKYIPDDSIDLIYLDPPFNSKATYNILFKEPTGKPSIAQIIAFEDTWHWTEETERTFQEIIKKAPVNVVKMMMAFRDFVGINDVMAYLTMMCIRMLELRRVLKDTGSIYLHCDPTASHYLKILMDTVFGKENFRNEIIWSYAGGGIPTKDFPRKHDILLRYTKTKTYSFKPEYKPYTTGTIQRGRTKIKGKYAQKGLRLEGTPVNDWWIDVPKITSPTDPEKLGFPTQKPIALLKRIISCSSESHSVVLDPFCGCGTTVIAAESMSRTWIGIDITHLAINLIKWRLKTQFAKEPKKDYRVIGEPVDFAGAKELAIQNRYQFQWWVLSLIDARPYGDKKRGADTGIDGFVYFMDEKDKIKSAVVQVKSGKASVKDIRDLGHVIDREKAKMGIFITLEPPTDPMKKEALSKGYYKSPTGEEFLQIQVLTVKEILEGKKPKLPPKLDSFKKAKRFTPNTENLEML